MQHSHECRIHVSIAFLFRKIADYTILLNYKNFVYWTHVRGLLILVLHAVSLCSLVVLLHFRSANLSNDSNLRRHESFAFLICIYKIFFKLLRIVMCKYTYTNTYSYLCKISNRFYGCLYYFSIKWHECNG